MSFTIYERLSVSLLVTICVFKSNDKQTFDLLMERLSGKQRMETREKIEKTEKGGSFCVKWTKGCETELRLLIEHELLLLGLSSEDFDVTLESQNPYIPPDKEKAELIFKRMFDYDSETK